MSVATFAAAQFLRLLPRTRLSRAVGRLCEAPLPPPVSEAVARVYARAYSVDMGEVAPRAGPYESFDDFFTRPLREGARRISADPVVSPADGALMAAGRVGPGAAIRVKGTSYSVGELVGDAGEAGRYQGGSFGVIYLSPSDYHRVHSPVDGEISLIRGIPGDLYPVNSIGERHVPQLFVRNQRVAIVIDNPSLGRVTAVMVGAIIVGRITVSVLPDRDVPPGAHSILPRRPVRRGDEIGIFHLGSTVVLLLPEGARISRPTGRVLYGESLVTAS